MAFSFKIYESKNLVTVICDDSTPSEERVQIIDKLVKVLLDNPSLNIFLNVSNLENKYQDSNENNFCDLFSDKKEVFINTKVAIYAGHKKANEQASHLKKFAFVYQFKNFALFDNKDIASFWVNN